MEFSRSSYQQFLKVLGPGVLFAGTAIGVSHLVQSTRAGADFGFTLIWAVIAANFLKYPFFEFGSRYAGVTGENLIYGYKKSGNLSFGFYLIITVSTMFFVTAAVGVVTAGFLSNLLNSCGITQWTVAQTAAVLFVITPLVLAAGKFKWLLRMVKFMGIVLLVCTIAVFVIALSRLEHVNMTQMFVPFENNTANIAFLLALMGWMPTAVDLSVWNSIWTLERIRETGFVPPLKQTLFEFRLGYWISGILAVIFVFLGALVIKPSETILSSNAGEFANQVVGVFAGNFGPSSWILMALAAFCIMLGTFIAIFDGFGRSVGCAIEILTKSIKPQIRSGENPHYVLITFTLSAGAFGLLYWFAFRPNNSLGFKQMVDLATTLSFLVAPVIAVMNYRLVTSNRFPLEARPGRFLKLQSLLGIIFLAGFAIYFMLF